jgi:hypothetical protein
MFKIKLFYQWPLLFFVFSLYANENAKYIGSLLLDPPTVVPYGHFVLRNLFFFDNHRGIYQANWNSSSRLDSYNSFQYKLQSFFGLTSFFDISLSPQFYCTQKGRYAYCNVGDLTTGLDFQLLEPEKFSSLPGIKFSVREVFPLGNYQLFNLKRGDMEKTGSGCFSTQLALFFYKGYQLSSNWFLNTAIDLQYQINSPISVKGFHTYGGGFGTDGDLFIGNSWQSLINLQLFYGKAISFSLDMLYEHEDASTFYGHPGLDLDGKCCQINVASSELFSLAPSFAYQFPSGLGFMVGSWLTISGRNAEEFIQYVANVFYIF